MRKNSAIANYIIANNNYSDEENLCLEKLYLNKENLKYELEKKSKYINPLIDNRDELKQIVLDTYEGLKKR